MPSRNQFRFYTGSLNPHASPQLDLEGQLHSAVEDSRLVLYYQPQVEIVTGKLVGAEALVRWHHQERGMVPPGLFIPLAEDSGLIVNIGEWVLSCTVSLIFSSSDIRFSATRTVRKAASDGPSQAEAHGGDRPRDVPLHRGEPRAGGRLWVREAL